MFDMEKPHLRVIFGLREQTMANHAGLGHALVETLAPTPGAVCFGAANAPHVVPTSFGAVTFYSHP